MAMQSLSGIWVSKPLLRLLIPFVFGILMSHMLQFNFELLTYGVAFSISLVLAIIVERKAKQYHTRILSGYLFIVSLIFAAGVLYELNCLNQRANFYGHFSNPNQETTFQVLVDEEPVTVKMGQRMFAKVQYVYLDDKKTNAITVGRILIYLKQDSTHQLSLHYGDQLIIHSKISEISKPKNPGDFDYGQYLKLNKVYRVSYIDESKILSLKSNHGNWLKSKAIKVKQDFISNLLQFPFYDGVAGIIAALVTGDSGITDPDLKNKFAATGTLHVLAVSGLHVGIIFVLLTWLTRFIVRFKNGKVTQLIIILIVLWFYAFFTGFSPSVTRAATMFSLISLGQQFGRKVNTINILSASALVMLAYNPLQLFSVGMQLSFSALAGILILTPHLTKSYTFKNKWVHKGFQLMCASLAAQLFTLPFSLFYFHQFSTYFLIANLVAIPLISIIASISFISFFVGVIPIVQKGIWYILDFLVFSLNFFIEMVASLPFALFSFLPFDLFQFIVLILVLIVLTYIIELKSAKLFPLLVAGVVLILIWLPLKEVLMNEKSLTLFNHPKEIVFKLKSGIQASYYSINFDHSVNLLIENQFLKRVENRKFNQIGQNEKLFHIPQIGTFTWIDSLSSKNNIAHTDFLIIHNPLFSPDYFDKIPEYKQVIFTSKKYKYHKYNWLKYFKLKKQSVFEMSKEGFFRIDFKNE